jgi:hypothetical protein
MTRQYTPRKMVESQEQDIPQGGTREFTESGELNATSSETADGHHHTPTLENLGFEIGPDGKRVRIRPKKWYDEMAFMNEMVTVRIHPSTDRNAHPLPDVYVNGRVQRFPRGEELSVRRCFVEVLARSRLTTFDNQKVKGPDGEDKYIYPAHTAEVYPFTVINDSPKGEAWLKSVLRSPR